MANQHRSANDDLNWLERLIDDPGSFDFHVAMRRFDAAFPERPRLGEAVRPSDEGIRVGQTPSSSFEPTAIASFKPAGETPMPRLSVSFLGLWGPHGPLPGHLTEYARDRSRHANDHTLASFVNIFQHRLLLMFHRAWAKSQPTVALDRPGEDAFAIYLGAFLGISLDGTRKRDAFPDRAKLYYAGRFASGSRNAEGLAAIVSDYYQIPAFVEEFVGEWLELPNESRWELGVNPSTGTLGRNAVVGARVWTKNHRFRIVLGPLSRTEFERMLPQSERIAELTALVRFYTNDEWSWDLRLRLATDASEPIRLGMGGRIGWTSRLGGAPRSRVDLVVDPVSRRTHRIQVPSSVE